MRPTHDVPAGLSLERVFDARVDRVFAALVRVVSAHGRLHGIEDFGTSMVFTPTRDRAPDCRRLTATTTRIDEQVLLAVQPLSPALLTAPPGQLERSRVVRFFELIQRDLAR